MHKISAIGSFNAEISLLSFRNPISAKPWHTRTHTHLHSMNKSHTLVGLSRFSPFSLLSQAAASPSSLQTPELSCSSFPSYPVWFRMGGVWIGLNLYPKSTQNTDRVNKLIKTFHRTRVVVSVYEKWRWRWTSEPDVIQLVETVKKQTYNKRWATRRKMEK